MCHILYSLFLVSVFFSATKSQTTAVYNTTCPSNWTLIADHCYMKLKEICSWEDANVRCHSYGGYILVLESDDEFWNINDVIRIEKTNIWLGCTDRYNDSTWVCYGENFSSALNWTEGQPNLTPRSESCLHVYKDPLLLDSKCTREKSVICEGKPDQLHASQFGVECPHGWILFDDRCYFQSGDRFNWPRSQMFCESFGGNLLTIDTEEEVMAVRNIFPPVDFWLGCRDHNSSDQYLCFWKNMSSIADWATYHPKSKYDCISVNPQFQLKTEACKNPREFVCEVKLSELTVGITETCPPRWVRANETCFFYSYEKLKWDEAEEHCNDAVSHLLVPVTPTERDVVRGLFPINDLWIGCKKHYGNDDLQCLGNNTAFLDFKAGYETSGSDDEHCLAMDNDGHYTRVNCTSVERNFVCMMPKDQYLGCYYVKGTKALAGGYMQFKFDNNLKNCMAFCKDGNYIFVGLQDSRSCFCGNDQYSRSGRRSDWECGASCTGQQSQPCGGSHRMVVYKAPAEPKSKAVTRKYSVKSGKRLEAYIYTFLYTPSLLTCAEACTNSPQCLSFNYCESGQFEFNVTKTCELTSGIRHYVRSEQYITDQSCTFGEVN